MASCDPETFRLAAIEKIFEAPFSTATGVRLLPKGRDSFHTIFSALREAKTLICLEFYIFRNDETGREVAEILKEKSRNGVQVCLLYDHFGSIGTPRSFWRDMRDHGISIRASRPFKWSLPFHYVHRDHRKVIIIDNRTAFTGGLNIANEYSGFHMKLRGRSWRDTGILLEGPVVADLLNTFKKSWYAWGGEPIPGRDPTGPEHEKGGPAELPVLPIFTDSSRARRRMRRLLYYSINRARQDICLTTAYFTPSRRLIETLEDAVRRGVRVRLLVPGVSDVPAASYAGRASFTRLLRAGIEIYTYQGDILHAKLYVFDGCWSVIGSANLDFLSMRFNDEGNVGILDEGFGHIMTDVFEQDLKRSVRIDEEEWRRRPLWEKVKERFFILFRRRL